MDLLQKFQQFISRENLFSATDRLLLAVSGGIDSAVLCELCHQAGYYFVIAHCNFQLRGQESDRDEAFVKALAAKYHARVLVQHFDTTAYAAGNKVSVQVAARELRYAWFHEIMNRQSPAGGRGASDDRLENAATDQVSPLTTEASAHHSPTASWIVTAHHLDDNVETMLMNFFKGTGVAGLRGILPKQGKIARPLLFAKKETLKQFAEENKLAWVEDSSNQSDKYARNYFRNQLIPLLRNVYPEAEQNLAGNLQRFKEIELLYHQSIGLHKKKLLEYKGNEVHIPILKLKKTVPLVSVLYEIIKDFHFTADQAVEAIALLDSETGKYIRSATHRIIKNRNWLIIAPVENIEAATILIEKGDREIVYAAGTLELQGGLPVKDSSNVSTEKNTACLDAAGIQFPLLLRKWKAGDYFYPLGMPKKKKISRFLIDQKLSKTDKEKTWVLEMNKKIIWVIGLRIDDRFKITPSTKQILQLHQKL